VRALPTSALRGLPGGNSCPSENPDGFLAIRVDPSCREWWGPTQGSAEVWRGRPIDAVSRDTKQHLLAGGRPPPLTARGADPLTCRRAPGGDVAQDVMPKALRPSSHLPGPLKNTAQLLAGTTAPDPVKGLVSPVLRRPAQLMVSNSDQGGPG
jgi:hypothetical protein